MKKLVLLMAMLVGLSTPSFAGSVGEGDTSCVKNQSTQARSTKTVIDTDVKSDEVKEKSSTES
jgi:hypothetical protein